MLYLKLPNRRSHFVVHLMSVCMNEEVLNLIHTAKGLLVKLANVKATAMS